MKPQFRGWSDGSAIRALAALGRPCAGFPVPTGPLTFVCNSSSSVSDALSWPSQGLLAHGAHAGKTLNKFKSNPFASDAFKKHLICTISFHLCYYKKLLAS